MMSSPCSYFQSLPIPQLERMYRDIQESDNAHSLVDDVRNLVEWLKTQPHLSHIKINQLHLMSTLLRQKSLEKAKRHLDFVYTARAVHAEYFVDWDPCTTRFQNIFTSFYGIPSKVLTPDGDVVWVIGFNNLHKVTIYDMLEQSTMFISFVGCHLPHRATIFVYDCKQITSQIIQAYLSAPRLASLFMKMNSLRLSKIYVLHPFPTLAMNLSILKTIPILKKKISNRIEIWNRNVNELASVLPAECLPRDYGGSCPSIDEQKDQFYKYVSQHRDWFKTECQKKARLDLRSRTINDDEDLFGFGVNGTFRKLSLD